MSNNIRRKLETRSLMKVIPPVLAVCLLLAAVPAKSQNTITTLAGNGASMFSGDNGPANTAALNHPRAVAFDAAGTIYIADVDNFRVRRVTPAGIISTFAGTGVFGATVRTLTGAVASAFTAAPPGGMMLTLTPVRRSRRCRLPSCDCA